eukprot:TRINITY_DN30033_c0_g1_i1.p1 TRINITY_DN30033_c0_g1~~TRINITY_DN30033_c0_g1_i1.p1  ORF type:complete len:289 (+),score=47.04 TRINITY_DN30033_c0_g1_i1:85-867(+)
MAGVVLYVTDPRGTEHCLELPLDATVGDVRRAVHRAMDSPADSLPANLCYSGAQLTDDSAQLSDIGISSESRLTCDDRHALQGAEMRPADPSNGSEVLKHPEGGFIVTLSAQLDTGVGSFTGVVRAMRGEEPAECDPGTQFTVEILGLRGNSDDFSVAFTALDAPIRALVSGDQQICWVPQRQPNEVDQLPKPQRLPVGAIILVRYEGNPEGDSGVVVFSCAEKRGAPWVEKKRGPAPAALLVPAVSVTYPGVHLRVCFH